MPHQQIRDFLSDLDKNIRPLGVSGKHAIAQAIKKVIADIENYKPVEEDIAEQSAFYLVADYRDADSGWGTYYGPMIVFRTGDGKFVESPSITFVTADMLKYWTTRANESANPILSFRYADLVVDFSPTVSNTKNFEIDMAKIVIDSAITICSQSLVPALQCKTKIHRALVLACRINDRIRIKGVARAIINLETAVAIDDKPGLWGFAFRWLILDSNKGVSLTTKERQRLLRDVEERLKRAGSKPYEAEKGVSLLAEYYAKERDEINLLRVSRTLEAAFKSEISANPDPLLATNRYQRMQEIYQVYADHGFKTANAEKNHWCKKWDS